MLLPPLDIELAISDLVINPSNSGALREDKRIVEAFLVLQGRPSRPIDPTINVRSAKDFDEVIQQLPRGCRFFDPFNILLRLVGLPQIEVVPIEEKVLLWNKKEFVERLVKAVCQKLDDDLDPLLVPRLVSVFINLEQERPPAPQDWERIKTIAVPGSRTYDRAAEAYRAYLRTGGNATIVTSGRAPYYDKNESLRITESEANAAYLRLLGVPADRIVAESASRDTTENAQFLPVILDEIDPERENRERCVLLVTSPFHLTRYRLSVWLALGSSVELFALGSKASRYWAETYFLSDAKSGYTREAMMGVIFNEYLKIAFDVCAGQRAGSKKEAVR